MQTFPFNFGVFLKVIFKVSETFNSIQEKFLVNTALHFLDRFTPLSQMW